jgi:hypothetical protein
METQEDGALVKLAKTKIRNTERLGSIDWEEEKSGDSTWPHAGVYMTKFEQEWEGSKTALLTGSLQPHWLGSPFDNWRDLPRF